MTNKYTTPQQFRGINFTFSGNSQGFTRNEFPPGPHLRPLTGGIGEVDKKVEMGLVTDVKTEIRKAEQYKLNYAANKAEF